jgi:hypothetical protein
MQNENKSAEPDHSPQHCEQQLSVAVGLQEAQPQAIQTLNWSSKSWTIAGIILTLLVATFFGLCTWSLNPLNSIHWALNIVASIIIVGILLIITWALRPCILLSVRRLDTAFKFERQWDIKQNKPSSNIEVVVTREKEYIMSYVGLAVALAGFLIIQWGNWGKSLGDKVAIVAMLVLIVYFIFCAISIGLHKKYAIGWIQWLSKVSMQIEFGFLSLSLGLFSLGISLLPRGYPWGVWTAMVLIVAGYVILVWGSLSQPRTTVIGKTDRVS